VAEEKTSMSAGKTAFTVASMLVLFSMFVALSFVVTRASGGDSDMYLNEARDVLQSSVLLDGHNDIPWKYRKLVDDRVFTDTLDLWVNQPALDTDIPRIRDGCLSAQFWSVYVSCEYQNKDAVRVTMEQIDVVYKLEQAYPDVFAVVTKASEIKPLFDAGKLPSLIGIEGGHQIDSSLGALRMFYKLGVRYMTITHNCNTPWADANVDPNEMNPHNGLTDFGKNLIREMNRIGMLVDLSHVSHKTMADALDIAVAPVIFSHSNAYDLCEHPRNVPDSILQRLPKNGGVVMITWVPSFTTEEEGATLYDVCDHIDHVKDLIGIDHVGVGADMDGIVDKVIGLEDVTGYPPLFAALLKRGYSTEELHKMAGLNVMRVLAEAEDVAANLKAQGVLPYEDTIYPADTVTQQQCRSSKL
jgi:membrane dipeptidase